MRYRFGRVSVDIISRHPAGYFLEDEMHPLGVGAGKGRGGGQGGKGGMGGKGGTGGKGGMGGKGGTGGKGGMEGKGEKAPVTLEVRASEPGDVPKGGRVADDIYADGDRYYVDPRRPARFGYPEFMFTWEGHPYTAPKLELRAHCDPRFTRDGVTRLASHLKRYVDWNYLHPVQRVAKNLTYNLLEPFLQMHMLRRGQTFIHTAAVHHDGGAVLFTGSGGTGKTATSLRLIMDHGFRFLTDDLMIIDDRARGYMYPKRMQVYAYNVMGFPELYDNLMKGRSGLERLQWHAMGKCRGIKGVRRRVSPHEMLGEERVGPLRSPISRIYFLRPKDGGRPEVRDADPEELARESKAVIDHELRSVFSYFYELEKATEQPVSMAGVLDHCERLYLEIFGKCRCSVLEVPKGSDPADTAKAVARDL